MMKKYIAAGIVAISVLGATTGCGFTGGKDIGKDAALEAALQDAGVTKEEATLSVSEVKIFPSSAAIS